MTREENVVAGKFKLLRKLSQGRLGEIYQAQRLDLPGAPLLVVKILRDRRYVELFKNEALALIRLCDSPNAPRLFEVNVTDTPAYIAMTSVPGVTLRDVLRNAPCGRLHWRTAARITVRILEAVASAHCLGLIHGDIKPENIMISEIDDSERYIDVRVLDFAGKPCARFSMPDENTASSMVLDDDKRLVVCSLRYLPGEFDRDAGFMPNPRTDVYAAGLVLAEMLTGTAGMITFPIEGVPGWLSTLVKKATNNDPEKRFADAAEMLEALRSRVEPEPRFPHAGLVAVLAASISLLIVSYLGMSLFNFFYPGDARIARSAEVQQSVRPTKTNVEQTVRNSDGARNLGPDSKKGK